MKIEFIDENTSLKDKNMTHKSKTRMSKWAEESSNEAMELLNKFTRWREDSQRHLVDIINSYNKSIDEGFNDLVKEVSDLHAKVSFIKNEVDDVPVEVDDFGDCSIIPLKSNLIKHEENRKNCGTPKTNSRSPILKMEEKVVDEP